MIAEVKKYPSHYLVLSLTLALGATAIIIFKYDSLLKSIITYSLGALYITWGIAHHRHEHLRLKVVLEYVLVALLGIVIINTLT